MLRSLSALQFVTDFSFLKTLFPVPIGIVKSHYPDSLFELILLEMSILFLVYLILFIFRP